VSNVIGAEVQAELGSAGRAIGYGKFGYRAERNAGHDGVLTPTVSEALP